MLLCFLAYVIATLTSYTVQFINCSHCLLDKTIWNQQFGWLGTTPKFKGILTIGWGKRWSSNYMKPLCDNYQTAHFEIISNRLFCGKFRQKGWVSIDPCSNIQLPVDAFNVLEACDKRGDKWFSCIHTIMEYIQDFHPKVYVYHICNNKKIEHQFTPDVDMKRRSLKADLSPGTQRTGVWYGHVYI